jgi:hypothetical protein
MSIGSEPACPVAVLESCGPSNTRRKVVLSGGRAETRWHCEPSYTQCKSDGFRLTVACRQVALGGRAPQNPTSCPVVRGGAANRRENICKTIENQNLTRTLCRCGHTRALRSVQRMPPGERVTHLPAPRCVQGIVPIDASDLGTC